MGRIITLGPEIASLIAAGEVIERPASIVKETVENSIDAGARSISVRVAGAGRETIRVADDGSGISPDDLDRLFRRHATSKLRDASDLEAIGTLGFRGEALYSIAAVSEVTLRSRVAGGEGWEIRTRGGREVEKRPAAHPEGTEIIVRELFFNTPARRRFLKSDGTENRRVIEAVLPCALAAPGIRFRLETEGRTVFNLPPSRDRKDRAVNALNLPADAVLEGAGKKADFSFRFLFGGMDIQRARGDLQFVFVNGRPVTPGRFGALANRVFRLVAPPGSFPFFALWLEMPPGKVDVNVHPTKREVRIRGEEAVFSAFFSAARCLLLSDGRAASVYLPPVPGHPRAAGNPEGETGAREAPATGAEAGAPSPETIREEAHGTLFEGPGRQSRSLPARLEAATWLGSFGECWIAFSAGDSLLVMDQHAAHERIAWELLVAEMRAGSVTAQQFLVPVTVPLSPAEMMAWEKNGGRLEKAGFSCVPWDETHLAIQAAPRLVPDPARAVRNILAGGNDIPWDEAELARRACHRAVSAGRRLDRLEAERLCRDLAACEDPFTCPHGRPTVVEIDDRTLRGFFRR